MHPVSRLQLGGLILAAVLAVGLGAIAVAGARVGASATPAGASRPAPTPLAAASTFGEVYLRVLDASASPARLPLSTAAVHTTAATDIIPAADRSGALSLALLRLTGQSGSRADALLVAAGGTHRYPFSLALARTSAGWVVAGLQPPDLGEILVPVAAHSAPAPAAAQHLAEALAGGTRLTYSPLQHGVLPVSAGRRTFFLRQRQGRWSLWYVQG